MLSSSEVNNVYYRKIITFQEGKITKLLAIFNNSICLKDEESKTWTTLISDFNNITNIYVHKNVIFFTVQCKDINVLYRLKIGQEPEQITFFEDFNYLIGFDNENNVIVKCGSRWVETLYAINLDTKAYKVYDKFFSHITTAIFLSNEKTLLARNGYAYLNWRAYKGGSIGRFWYDNKEISFDGNIVNIQFDKKSERVYFIGEINGAEIGNVYSCTLSGKDIKQHSTQKEYTVTDYSLNNGNIYYIAGGNLYNDTNKQIHLSSHAKAAQLYIQNPGANISHVAVDSNHGIAYIARGILFLNEAGCSARQYSDYKYACFLNKERLLGVKLDGQVVILSKGQVYPTNIYLDILDNLHSYENKVLASCSRNSLSLITVEDNNTASIKVIAKESKYYMSCSVYKDWIAYTDAEQIQDNKQIIIKNLNNLDKVVACIPDAVSPCFSADGKFLAFIQTSSCDNHVLIANLDPNTASFITGFKPFPEEYLETEVKEDEQAIKKSKKKSKPKEDLINFDNIQNRGEILNITSQSLLFANSQGILYGSINCSSKEYDISYYNFSTKTSTLICSGANMFNFNNTWLVAVIDKEIGTTKISEALSFAKAATKENGGAWKLQSFYINRAAEWNRILYQAWLLQKHHFYNPNVKVNWEELLAKYQRLANCAYSKSDIKEIIHLMHGDLKSSHAYIISEGEVDYTANNFHNLGHLCANINYEDNNNAWIISKINRMQYSPLGALEIKENDQLIAIDGQILSAEISPNSCLIDKANRKVRLRFAGYDKDFYVTPCTCKEAHKYAYRYHVDNIANQLHKKSIWYIHIPDMSTTGFIEFNRQYHARANKNVQLKYLLVDLRDNAGGHISEDILKVLSQKRLGAFESKAFGLEFYPNNAPPEKMVFLINENTGSDGDLMAYSVKKLKLGPIYGRCTVGALIGIFPRRRLLDGTITSQAEFYASFEEQIENRGIIPDIEIINLPNDDVDEQLEFAVNELLKS